MSCINSLSQADIGLSQKVMRNAKTFYHNSTIGAPPGLVLHLSNYPLEHQEGKVRFLFFFFYTKPDQIGPERSATCS